MKFLVVLAIVLLATKKAADFLLAIVCVLLFGYGSYVLIREIPKSRLIRSHTPSLLP